MALLFGAFQDKFTILPIFMAIDTVIGEIKFGFSLSRGVSRLRDQRVM